MGRESLSTPAKAANCSIEIYLTEPEAKESKTF
jgi:hypothetical protein